MKSYPFYEFVPKGFKDNLKWRLSTRTRAQTDRAFRSQLLKMCEVDLMFWINGFVWLHEPRPRMGENGMPLPQIIPFISWEHQDPVIMSVDEYIGFEDIAAEKSRGEGASWIAMMITLHRWLFFPMTTVGLISRTQDAVDNTEDMDSLMTKLDWELTQLPVWMVGVKDVDYSRNYTRHTLKNNRNNSVITGYSATGDVMSGGRKSFIIFDELAKFPRGDDNEAMDSTQHVTESRFIISTPKGAEGAYYDVMNKDGDLIKLVLDWKDNQTRNRGLFRITRKQTMRHTEKFINEGLLKEARDSVFEMVDADKYGEVDLDWSIKFIQDGIRKLSDRGYPVDDPYKVWSPWYVKQCLRPSATPQSIAQELDRDYGGSVSRFFSAVMIERLLQETARKPTFVGDLQYHTATYKSRFLQNPSGRLYLWTELVGGKFPPRNCDYVIGADVSTGQGGEKCSNSVLTVVSRYDGKKVAELASPNIPPEELADYAIALSMWFVGPNGHALLIHEDMGPGVQFRNRILETSFRSVYYRGSSDQFSKKKTKKIGWVSNKRSKRELLGAYSYALGEGLFVNPNEVALEECKEYQVGINGLICHTASISTKDPAGAGEAHGDRVIADALANWVLYELREGHREFMKPLEVRPDRVPPTSILGLRLSLEEKEKGEDLW